MLICIKVYPDRDSYLGMANALLFGRVDPAGFVDGYT